LLDNILERGAGTLPPEIFQCPNVKSLSLKNNFLEWLHPEVGRLGRLERLVLTHNLLKNQSIPLTLSFCRYVLSPVGERSVAARLQAYLKHHVPCSLALLLKIQSGGSRIRSDLKLFACQDPDPFVHFESESEIIT
jgi:hypothetical protein